VVDVRDELGCGHEARVKVVVEARVELGYGHEVRAWM
jgi:hypothetical protein